MHTYNPFNQKKIYKVITAIITVIAFMLTTLGRDITWAISISPQPGRSVNISAFNLPHNFGTIENSWIPDSKRTPNNEQQTTIIHIQDAHCNYAGQKKIAKIIEYFNKEYGINTVNLEGGEGRYDLSPFTRIQDKVLREKVSDYFVKRGIINGAEYFAVNNPEKVKLWGIENTDLYLKNLDIYKELMKHKEEIDKYLKSSETSLNNLKQRIYSRELLEFDRKTIDYQENKIEFKDYVIYLYNIDSRSPHVLSGERESVKHNNLRVLYQSLALEQTLNFSRADTERDKLIDALQKTLSQIELKELISKTIEFKKEDISQKDFYAYLVTKAICAGLDLEEFPELKKYINYISAYEAINKTKIIAEIKELENEIKKRLFENDKQRELDRLSKNLLLTKKLFNLNLTRDEYDEYKASNLQDGTAVKKFYEYSFQRDRIFIRNVERTMKHEPLMTILITGGFHSENLHHLFKQNNIPYISVMPNFKNEEGYKCPYFELLKGNILTKISMMAIYSCLCGEKTQKVHQIGPEDINAAVDSTIDLFKNGVEKTKIIDQLVRHIKKIEEEYKIAILEMQRIMSENAEDNINRLKSEYEAIIRRIDSYMQIITKGEVLYRAFDMYKARLEKLHNDILGELLRNLMGENNELTRIEKKIQKDEKELKRITANLDWIEEKEKRLMDKLESISSINKYNQGRDAPLGRLHKRLNSFAVYKQTRIEMVTRLEREIGKAWRKLDEEREVLKDKSRKQLIDLANRLRGEFEYCVYTCSFPKIALENKKIIIEVLYNSDEFAKIKEETSRRIAAENLFREMMAIGDIALPEASLRMMGEEGTIDKYWGVYKAFNFTDIFKNDADVKEMVNGLIAEDYYQIHCHPERGSEGAESKDITSDSSAWFDFAHHSSPQNDRGIGPQNDGKGEMQTCLSKENDSRAVRKKVLAVVLGFIWVVALFLPICKWLIKKHISRSVKEKPPVALVPEKVQAHKVKEKKPQAFDVEAIVKSGLKKEFFAHGGIDPNHERLKEIQERAVKIQDKLRENNQKIAEYEKKIQSDILTPELKQKSMNLREQAQGLESTFFASSKSPDYKTISSQEWKTVSVKAGGIDISENLSRLQDAKENGPEIKDYFTRVKIDHGEGNLYPGTWVADCMDINIRPISSHLSIKSFSAINPLTGEFLPGKPKWKKLSFGQNKKGGEWVIMPVNGNKVLPLALPPGKMIVDVQPDRNTDCQNIQVYYDEANRAWYLEFDKAPELVRVMTRTAEKDELEELPFIEIEDSVKDRWKDALPAPIKAILSNAGNFSPDEWQELKKEIYKLFYYSTNPCLRRLSEAENDFLSFAFKYFSLNCDGLTMLDAILSHARGERMCVQEGFLDLNGDGRFYALHNKGDHVFSLTPRGIEEKTLWVKETSALYGKKAEKEDWQSEEQYIRERAKLAYAHLQDIADFAGKKRETKALEKEMNNAKKEIEELKSTRKGYDDEVYYRELTQYYDKQLEELSRIMTQNIEACFGLSKRVLSECENFVFSEETIKDKYQLMAIGHFLLKITTKIQDDKNLKERANAEKNVIYENAEQYAEKMKWVLDEPLEGHLPGVFYKARWRGQKEDLTVRPYSEAASEGQRIVTDSLTGKEFVIPARAEIIDYQNGVLWVREDGIDRSFKEDRLFVEDIVKHSREEKFEQLLSTSNGVWIVRSVGEDSTIFVKGVIIGDGGRLEERRWAAFDISDRKIYLMANGSFIGIGADSMTKAEIDDSWTSNEWYYFGIFNGEIVTTLEVEAWRDWDHILEPLFFDGKWAGAGRREAGDWEIVGSGKEKIERFVAGRRIIDWKDLPGDSFIILVDNGDGTQSFIGPGAVEFGINGSFLKIGRPIEKILEVYPEGLVVTRDKPILPIGHIRFWGPLAYKVGIQGKGLFYGRYRHPKFTSDGKWVTAVAYRGGKWGLEGTLVSTEVKNMRFDKIIGVDEGDQNAIMIFDDNNWAVFVNTEPDGRENWAIIGSPDIMARYPGTFEARPEKDERPCLLSDGTYYYRFGVNYYHYDNVPRRDWLTRVIDLYDISSISAAGHIRKDRLDIWWRYVDNLAKQDETLAAVEMDLLLLRMEELLDAEKGKVYTTENPCPAYTADYDEIKEIISRNLDTVECLSSNSIARLLKILDEIGAEHIVVAVLNNMKMPHVKQKMRTAITKCSFRPEEWERIFIKSIQYFFPDYREDIPKGPCILPFSFDKKYWDKINKINALLLNDPKSIPFKYISDTIENINVFDIPLPERDADMVYDKIRGTFLKLRELCGRNDFFDVEISADTRKRFLYKAVQLLRKFPGWLKLKYNAWPWESAWLKDGENRKKWHEINQQFTDILGDDVKEGITLNSKALLAIFWKELIHDAIGLLFLIGFVSVFMSFVSDRLKKKDKNIGLSARITLKTMWKHAKYFRGKRAENAYAFLKGIAKNPDKNLSYGEKARLEILRQTLPYDQRAVFDIMCAVCMEVTGYKTGILKRLINFVPGAGLFTSIDSSKFRKRQAMNKNLLKLVKKKLVQNPPCVILREAESRPKDLFCIEILRFALRALLRMTNSNRFYDSPKTIDEKSTFSKIKQTIVKLLKQTGNLYVISSLVHSPKPNGSSKSSPGEEGEFLESKEYEWGDDIRRINWPKYASTGGLIVKITETDITKEADILVNMRSLFKERDKDIFVQDLVKSVIAIFDKRRLNGRDKYSFDRFIFIMPDGTIEVEKNTRAKKYEIKKGGLANILSMLEDKYDRAKIMTDAKGLKFYTDEQNKRYMERNRGIFTGENLVLDNLTELLAKLKIKNKHVFSVGIEEKDKEDLSFLLGKRTITLLFWKQNIAQPFMRRAENKLNSGLPVFGPQKRAGPKGRANTSLGDSGHIRWRSMGLIILAGAVLYMTDLKGIFALVLFAGGLTTICVIVNWNEKSTMLQRLLGMANLCDTVRPVFRGNKQYDKHSYNKSTIKDLNDELKFDFDILYSRSKQFSQFFANKCFVYSNDFPCFNDGWLREMCYGNFFFAQEVIFSKNKRRYLRSNSHDYDIGVGVVEDIRRDNQRGPLFKSRKICERERNEDNISLSKWYHKYYPLNYSKNQKSSLPLLKAEGRPAEFLKAEANPQEVFSVLLSLIEKFPSQLFQEYLFASFTHLYAGKYTTQSINLSSPISGGGAQKRAGPVKAGAWWGNSTYMCLFAWIVEPAISFRAGRIALDILANITNSVYLAIGLAALVAGLVFWLGHVFRGKEVMFDKNIMALGCFTSLSGIFLYFFGWHNPIVWVSLSVLTMIHMVVNGKALKQNQNSAHLVWWQQLSAFSPLIIYLIITMMSPEKKSVCVDRNIRFQAKDQVTIEEHVFDYNQNKISDVNLVLATHEEEKDFKNIKPYLDTIVNKAKAGNRPVVVWLENAPSLLYFLVDEMAPRYDMSKHQFMDEETKENFSSALIMQHRIQNRNIKKRNELLNEKTPEALERLKDGIENNFVKQEFSYCMDVKKEFDDLYVLEEISNAATYLKFFEKILEEAAKTDIPLKELNAFTVLELQSSEDVFLETAPFREKDMIIQIDELFEKFSNPIIIVIVGAAHMPVAELLIDKGYDPAIFISPSEKEFLERTKEEFFWIGGVLFLWLSILFQRFILYCKKKISASLDDSEKRDDNPGAKLKEKMETHLLNGFEASYEAGVRESDFDKTPVIVKSSVTESGWTTKQSHEKVKIEKTIKTAKDVLLQEEKTVHSIVIVGDSAFTGQPEAVSKAAFGELGKEIRKIFEHKRENHIYICKSYEEAGVTLEKIKDANWHNTFFYVDSRIKVAKDQSVFDRFIKITLKTENDGSILMAVPISGYTAYSQVYSDLITRIQNLHNARKPEEIIKQDVEMLIDVMTKIKGGNLNGLISGLIGLIESGGKESEIVKYVEKYQNQHTWALPYVKQIDWEKFYVCFKAEAKTLRSL